MKTDRFSSLSIRTAAVLLAGLLLAAGHPAAGQIVIRFGKKTREKASSVVTASAVAAALAQQVGEVRKMFAESRRALHIVKGPHGESAYAAQEVAGLVARTEEDLGRAIDGIGELDALHAWSDDELGRIREKLETSASLTAASPFGPSTPRAVAVVASLGSLPLPRFASVNAATPQTTIAADKANGFLDEVGEVVSRIFFLADHDDLEVKLWIGSAPAPKVKFSFQPKGRIKGEPPPSKIIRTNGKLDHVLRGLYSYEAAWTQGAVTQVIRYPTPAGVPAAQIGSERLDLVKDTGFFCCKFKDGYCHHVANEKECRP